MDLKANIYRQPLGVLCNRIIEALSIEYNDDAADAALSYINNEMDDSEELIDDLSCGHQESGLVDCILSNTGIPHAKSQNVCNLLIRAANGNWINERVTKIRNILFYPEIVEANSYIASEEEGVERETGIQSLQETEDWLKKQCEYYPTYDPSLIKLFTIGRKQDMTHLPALIYEIYSEWRIKYIIDRKKKGKTNKQPMISDFIRKSKAFREITEKNRRLIASAVDLYGRTMIRSPVISPLLQIEDDLYEFVQYTYIMSEVINNLITSNAIILPLQIDIWIIPKKNNKPTFHGNTYDDSDDDAETNDIDKEKIDYVILNIEQRLHLDYNLKYKTFSADFGSQRMQSLQEKLQRMIKFKTGSSHNRVVCIIDRREKYHDFKFCTNKDWARYLNNDIDLEIQEKKAKLFNYVIPYFIKEIYMNAVDIPIEIIDLITRFIPIFDGDPMIEIDFSSLNTKQSDTIFIFQPPHQYGKFPSGYIQEHLFYLSKEYMIPKAIIKHPLSSAYFSNRGTFNDFDHQMFAVSFCCHSKRNIRLQWYLSGWSMRISKLDNFTTIWPQYFDETQNNEDNIERIKNDILKHWKLPIRNKEYEMYEKDILRFEHFN